MLDSTEIYDGVKWNIVENARLPYGTVWSKIIQFDEKILLFGTVILYDAFYILIHIFFKGGSDYKGSISEQTFYDFILEFNPETETWAQIGVMTSGRAAQGVAIVNFEDFKDVCTF